MHLSLAFLGGMSTPELVVVMILGLLLFGARLPEVGRSLGRTMAEFKRGMKGFEHQMTQAEQEATRMLEESDRAKASSSVAESHDHAGPASTPDDHPPV